MAPSGKQIVMSSGCLRDEYTITGKLSYLGPALISLILQLFFVQPKSTAHWFGIDISYDFGFNQSKVNGTVASIIWKSQGDDTAKVYEYAFDNTNRLLKDDFSQSIGSSFNNGAQMDFNIDSLQYDANGNMLLMQPKGLVINTSAVIHHFKYS